jgi:non-specific serine/threonine protein kinase
LVFVAPPLGAFWRDVGRAFVVRLCATEDLETLRAKIEVEVPPDELAALAAAAPPMTGGEYLTPTVVADLCARLTSVATGSPTSSRMVGAMSLTWVASRAACSTPSLGRCSSSEC